MAVQAQYPSNILFLNNRNGQETKNITMGNNDFDYDLRPQQPVAAADGGIGGTPGGGVFFDQSQMFLNNNNNNNNNANGGGGAVGYGGLLPRKRGRGEMTTTVATTTNTAATTAANNNIHPFNFSLQNQQQPPPQIIDLTQLQNHNQQPAPPPPSGVSTGLGLSFGEHQLQRQHPHQHNLASSSQSSSFLRSVFSDEFANQIKQQTDELNQFIQLQGEHLRRALAEKRQRHYRALITAAEETVSRRLREKDAEVQKAARRNAELEARAAQLASESQAWQAKIRAQEALAASLHAQLQQAMLSSAAGGGGTACTSQMQDNNKEGAADDAESAYVDPERVHSVSGGGGPSCKACRRRVASVVLLPCRHLCVCADCDAVVQACPLCLSVRNASVQVYLT